MPEKTTGEVVSVYISQRREGEETKQVLFRLNFFFFVSVQIVKS